MILVLKMGIGHLNKGYKIVLAKYSELQIMTYQEKSFSSKVWVLNLIKELWRSIQGNLRGEKTSLKIRCQEVFFHKVDKTLFE